MKIGFIGLGNVGGKLSGSLIRNGHDVTVLDLNPDLVAEKVATGAVLRDHPQVIRRREPRVELEHVRVVQRVHRLHFGRDLLLVSLLDAPDGDKLDRALEPALVDGGEAAVADLVVEYVVLHGRRRPLRCPCASAQSNKS